MSDKLAVIQSEESKKALNEIKDSTKELIVEFKNLVTEANEVNKAFGSGKPKEYVEALKRAKEIESKYTEDLQKLTDAQKKLQSIEKQLTVQRSEEAGQIATKSEQLRKLTAENRNLAKEQERLAGLSEREKQRLGNTIQLYNSVQAKLNKLQAEYKNLATAKELGITLSDKENARMVKLQGSITKYDDALKAVDGSMGKHQRNVGNYASGWNALNSSVGQLAREMPAFTYSAQTGFMALSNNIPIFVDALKSARLENERLTASGQQGVPIWKQLGNAVFSWNTLLSIAITLTTVYGKQIGEWVNSLVGGKKAIDSVKLAQESLNEAYKDNSVKKAVSDIEEMKNVLQLAKDGVIDKKRALDTYNDGLGKVIGSANSLNDIEQLLVKNGDAYIKMTLYKAAAEKARDKQADALLKAEESRNKKLKEFESGFDKASFALGYDPKADQAQQRQLQKEYAAENAKIRKQNAITEAENEARANEKIVKTFMDKVKEEGKGLNLTSALLGSTSGKSSSSTSGRPYKGSRLSGGQRDVLMELEAQRDNLLASNKLAFTQGLKIEKDYLKDELKINTDFYDKKIAYLKGGTAKEKQLVAKAQLDKISDLKDTQKKLFDIEFKESESNYKQNKTELERQFNNLTGNDFYTNTERVDKQLSLNNELLANAQDYWTKQIELAKNSAQSTIDLERQRDEEIGKLQDTNDNKQREKFKALSDDLNIQTEIAKTNGTITYEQQKALILADKRLTISQKEFEIAKLDKIKSIESNNLEIEKLEALKEQLAAKILLQKLSGLTNQQDEAQLANYEAQILNLKNQNTNTEKDLSQMLSLQMAKVRDVITDGLRNLGFEGLANEFNAMFDKIINKTADWRDYTKLAAEAVGASLTKLSNSSKERTISNLNEQLRVSQENTEQEIGFNQGRIDQLNSLSELTAEQITERDRLEDESRTWREQQQQREKLIAIQKAKAEQRASAQQALINGAVAATKTMAELGFPAGVLPASIALAFGVAQSIAIAAKTPIPQYFVGRKGGKREKALTQEKGAEIITDRNGNIKTLGSDNGAVLTQLEAGDNVYTAAESKNMMRKLKEVPKIGDNLLNKVAMQSLISPIMPIIQPKTEIDYQKLGSEVAKQYERIIKSYDKPTIIRENGKIIKYSGKNLPTIVGFYDLVTLEETYYNGN